MELLERQGPLERLDTALVEAATGNGQVVLISGEAGIGKTSLVEHFSKLHNRSVRFLRGTCDPLFTPHPLCPLHDMARQLPDSELSELIWGKDRLLVFYTFLQELQECDIPTVVIFEDVHWADEASLDLIRFLSRRIQDARAVIIATYRDDELHAEHPLWLILGNLKGPQVHRLRLKPLSQEAVATLAEQSGRHIENLHAMTSGNPFYVSEMLAGPYDGVPLSVRETVLARTRQLSPEARDFLELASVIPKERFERPLYQAIMYPSKEVLDACTVSGLVHLEGDAIIFRHELARQAVAESLPVPRWQKLNDLAVHALLASLEEGQQVSRAHLVHHAHQANNSEIVLRFAAEAAQEASALGAHREATIHYQSGLAYADRLSPSEHADLLESLAYECYLTGQIEDAAQHRSSALEIRRRLHQQELVGQNLRWLSRLNWFLGKRSLAERYAAEAVDTLEALPPRSELAMAYSNQAQLDMLSSNEAGAVHWAAKAITLAKQADCVETLSHALNNMGAAQWFTDNTSALQNLKESLRLALENNLEEHAARAYTNMGCMATTERQYKLAEKYLDEGIEYAVNHDLDSWSYYMQGWRARVYLEQGQWNQATKEATEVIRIYRKTGVIRLPALENLALLRVRRGDPRADELLAEVYETAQHTSELQRIIPVTITKVELAWLQEELDQVVQELRQLLGRAPDPWTRGLLAIWLWRAGELPTPPDNIAHPFHLQISGDWQAAADEWARCGCPYEQALALMDGDADAQRVSLTILEQLGAGPVVDLLRKRMRLGGIRGISRGPRRDTQQNPAGLTQRQMDVLSLLIEGLSDNEIAEKLFISPKTAGHHVSAILSKLDVRSRQEAAVLAVQRAWFAQESDWSSHTK